MDLARSFGLIIIISLVVTLVPLGSCEPNEEEKDISKPGKIPGFGNFTTPQMIPGDTGTLSFSLTNRYDQSISDVSVTIEIYLYANIHESKNLSRVNKIPNFINSGNQTTIKMWNSIESGNDHTKRDAIFRIKSWEGTEQGTYFVRFRLDFEYNGNRYTMKSRGHFSNEEWEEATTNTSTGDPGNINITKLGVSGIIPDTTFGVKKPWPIWPLYVLGMLTVTFAALAILTYMYEENTNPGFTRWIHKQQRKLWEYRAIMIHELGKFKKRENE